MRLPGLLSTNGNPSQRGGLSRLHNLRPMLGELPWYRLVGGVKGRWWGGGGGGGGGVETWKQWHEYVDPKFGGWPNHLGQRNALATSKWVWASLYNWTMVDIENIATAYDGGWALTNAVAVTNIRDRVIIYNGLGVRDATTRPPFSCYFPSDGILQYFGLDMYPRAGGATGVQIVGNITTLGPVRFAVGLWNKRTGHFSNGYKLTGQMNGALVGWQFSALQNVRPADHGPGEEGDLRFVFYATLPRGKVYYQVMNPDGIDPMEALITSNTHNIIDLSTPQIDITKEMPFANHPARPMRDLCFGNGRLYGVLMNGGSGVSDIGGFSYSPSTRYQCGLVYSASQGPETEYVGSTEDSWPLDNFTACPSSEVPLKIDEEPGGQGVLAITGTRSFIVQELADGSHLWTKLGWLKGIRRAETYTRTPYGSFWVSQDNEFILMGMDRSIVVLSRAIQQSLLGLTPIFSTYVLDPVNQIDAVEVHFTNGTAIVYDFTLRHFYSKNTSFTCGKMLRDPLGRTYHLLAANSIFTQAGQPEHGLEHNRNIGFDGAGAVLESQLQGELVTHFSQGRYANRFKSVDVIRVHGDVDNVSIYATLGNELVQGTKLPAGRERDTYPTGRWQLPKTEGGNPILQYRVKAVVTGPIPGDQGNTLPTIDAYMEPASDTRNTAHVTQGAIFEIIPAEKEAGVIQL